MSYGVRAWLRSAAAVTVAAALVGLSAHTAVAATDSNSACELPSERDLAVTKEMHQTAAQQGVDDKVLLATFEAGWVISHANNLDCGDQGGVFKLEPGSEWCETLAECREVEHVTAQFLSKASDVHDANPDFSAGEIAAGVVSSAYPDRFDNAEDKAKSLITEAAQQS